MSEKDEYFTHKDKPYAENFNDALLLSNLWDYTVSIEVPTMFQDKEWLISVGSKKCGVAIIGLKEALDGIHSTISNNQDAVTGSGVMKLSFYPNFNTFGGIQSVEWDATGTVRVDIYDNEGRSILPDIDNGLIENQPPSLRTLQEFELRVTLTNATLRTLKVTMKNKEKERWGAEVSKKYVITKVNSVIEDLISYGE